MKSSYFQLISLHVFISLVAIDNCHIYQMDVITVFLYGNLKKKIHIEQPPWFIQHGHDVVTYGVIRM
jgi:hypothetical protein